MDKELEFIQDKINNKEYTLVPNTLAINDVYKIHLIGDLNTDGFEIGYLYIPAGSGIKNHTHINDIERYKLLSGSLIVNGENAWYNICTINNSHNIEPTDKPIIVQTCKINRNYLDKVGNQSNEDFEDFVNKIISDLFENGFGVTK